MRFTLGEGRPKYELLIICIVCPCIVCPLTIRRELAIYELKMQVRILKANMVAYFKRVRCKWR